MQKSHLFSALYATIFCVAAMPTQAALIAVLNDQAYYDTVLNITWAKNADLNGRTNFATASTAAANLTIDGVDGWRLPSMDVNNDTIVIDCMGTGVSETNCRDNELAHLYYYGGGTTLGSGITSASPGSFTNLQSGDDYWSTTDSLNSPPAVWRFNFGTGVQNDSYLTSINYAWAVHNGNAALVPLPAALWLFGSGALGLVTAARRQRRSCRAG